MAFSMRSWRGLLAVLFCLASLQLASSAVEGLRVCSERRFEGSDSLVCVCNSTYCDDLPTIVPGLAPEGTYLSFRSSRQGDRFVQSEGNFDIASCVSPEDAVFTISNAGSYQNIIGFGGAFTDAAAINILSLSKDAQDNLLQSYFSSAGLEYNMGRVPMAGTDFSTRIYSYDDSDNDFELRNFSLAMEDIQMKIPLIQKAGKIVGQPLNIFASPWSAPGWMKSNGKMVGGQLKGQAGDNYHKTWAQYFVKFVQAYESNKIPIWGLTTQNEPLDGYIPFFPFEAMGFTAASQRDFIAKDLGPALEKAGLRRIKLIIMDDQRFLLPRWADIVLANQNAAQYVDGIGVHWYFDAMTPASVLSKTHKRHPEKFLLSTEACEGSLPWQTKVILADWGRAESYSQDIMENLQNWVGGWIDWNLALNTQGGPNWDKNYVDSPIIVNQSADEFFKQPMFYALGHFSKFIRPESVIIKGQLIPSSSALQIISAQRTDGGVVVVVLNKSNKNVRLTIVDGRLQRGCLTEIVAARSLQTFIWW